jgi:negative regulator of sigma E activity
MRAYHAQQRLQYRADATATVLYCGQEFRTRCRVLRRGSDERIEYTSGPMKGLTVTTVGGQTEVRGPEGRGEVLEGAAGRSGRLVALNLVLRNYEATHAGSECIGGRQTDIVDLTPRHRAGGSRRLWVDRGTGLVLRSREQSSSGQMRSSMELTRVVYCPVSGGEIAASTGRQWPASESAPRVTAQEAARRAGIVVNEPRYIPKGYELEGIRVHRCRCGCGQRAAHLRYTDGLNSISVFLTPSSPACAMGGCKVHCAGSSACEVRDSQQALVAATSSRGRSVIVVADLRQEELRKIAKSIQ